MENKSVHTILKTNYNLKYQLIIDGIIVGVFASLVCIAYRYILTNAENLIFYVSSFVKDNVFFMILLCLALGFIAFLVSCALKYEAFIGGSGIPQIEGEIINQIDQNWWRVLCLKFGAGILCVLGGLSLGREGPSIQLGGMCGKGFAKIKKRLRIEQRYLITCGASAGLAAAFNAPLAGIMFALEELHKNFSSSVLISVTISSIVADFISQSIFGLTPALHIEVIAYLPLSFYVFVVVLGIICGLLAAFYNKATLFTQDTYKKIPFLKSHQYIYIAFLFAFIAILFMPDILGGGHHMFNLLSENMAMSSLIVLLVAKFIFSMISFGSGAVGGIFFPVLVLGSYIGAIYGNVVQNMFGIDASYLFNFVILAMAGFLSGIVRAPITGIVLIAEMTGSLQHLSSLAIVSIVAYVVAHFLKSKPIYESLLHRLLDKHKIHMDTGKSQKRLVENMIEVGSLVDEKKVQDIEWPKGCLLVGIRHGASEVLPKGDTILYAGSTIIALLDEPGATLAEATLQKITQRQ